MRLDKFIAGCGIGSRKDVKALIRAGRVQVNDTIAKREAVQVDEKQDSIKLDGELLFYTRFQYLMLHKPAGVVSATFDQHFQTVLDLVPEQYRHFDLFPVGRLDIDTTGLLFLTNDGALAHRLTSPRHHAEKTYFVRVDGFVGETDVLAFRDGIRLDDGYLCKSAALRIVSAGAESEVELTIHEGKFHQVKRMFEAVGKRVLVLKRLSMGGVTLDPSLPEGEMRPLTQAELEKLNGN